MINKNHLSHLEGEGLSYADIEKFSKHQMPESWDSIQSETYGILGLDPETKTKVNPAGLAIPAGTGQFQLRADLPVLSFSGDPTKYLSRAGASTEAWYPHGIDKSEIMAVTEGWKDAMVLNIHGILCASLVGVGCYKDLPLGCGYIVIFDSDGWKNPEVFRNLIKAGFHTGGEVLLIPPIPHEPKGGAVELFRASMSISLADALDPRTMLRSWPDKWSAIFRDLPKEKILKIVNTFCQLAGEYLPRGEAKGRVDDLIKSGFITHPEKAKKGLDQGIEKSPEGRKKKRRKKGLHETRVNPTFPDKPTINIYQGQIDLAAHQTQSLLSESKVDREKIYVRGHEDHAHLVRVVKATPDTRGRHIFIGTKVDVLAPIDCEALKHELNKRFQFKKWNFFKKDGGGYWDDKPIDCPQSLAQHILKAGAWSQLPKITGITYAPLPSKTGEVIEKPGFHSGSGFLLQFDLVDFPKQKPHPSKQDAVLALAVLKDLLREFPFRIKDKETFEHNASLSGTLSLLLTAIWRKTFSLAPLHAVSATVAGTGKGTLIGVASTLLTGQNETGVVPFSSDGEETRKKITAILSAGTPIINLDNVNTKLGGNVLEMCLTSTNFKDRLLGVSTMIEVSTQALWVANGNNLQFSPDMGRRTILIELDPQIEKPEEREFKRDIAKFTLENRGRLVDACLTIPRAYLLAGSPNKPKQLGSFGDWSDLIRGALIWLGEIDPVDTQTEVARRDETRNQLAVILNCWYQALGEHEQTAKRVITDATNPQSEGENFADLRLALTDICLDQKTGQLSSKRLGYYLRRFQGRVVDGLKFESKKQSRQKIALWCVVPSGKPYSVQSLPASPAPIDKNQEQQYFSVAGDQKSSPATLNLHSARDTESLAGNAGDDLGQINLSDSVKNLQNVEDWTGEI